MIHQLRRLSKGIALAAALMLLITGMAVAADAVNLLGYQIDFLGFVDNGDNTSTWTYALTADGDEPEAALSHWNLGIHGCYEPRAPENDTIFTTPTTGYGCGTIYNCEQTMCTVEYGTDPQNGIDGIKFQDCVPQLSNEAPLPRTHLFQFTVQGVPNVGGDVAVGVKMGTQSATGTITGPACSPTTVRLRSFQASTWPLAGGAVLVALAALGLLSRRFRG